MSLEVLLQIAVDDKGLPDEAQLVRWARAALRRSDTELEMGLRVVSAGESAELNRQYRHKPGPTNVLSFPYDPDQSGQLGDLAICADVVAREARQQDKTLMAHWAHMVVHGVLHLQGFDHLEPHQAEQMEGLEREILAGLGFADPYAGEEGVASDE